MLSGLARLLLTSTAIAPVLLTYGWVAFREGASALAGGLILFCFFLVFLCLGMLRYAEKSLEEANFKTTTVEAADRENMAFLLLYLLPLFTAEFDKLNWDLWIPAVLVFALVVLTGYNYHFNPLLGLMGWHFYKVGTIEGVSYILITKKQLRSARGVMSVRQLTEYILIDIERR